MLIERRARVFAILVPHVKDALKLIGAPGLQVLVLDDVSEPHCSAGNIRGVACGARQLGRYPRHAHALPLVIRVRVLGKKVVSVVEPLVRDEPHALEARRAQRERDFLQPTGEHGREGLPRVRDHACVLALLIYGVELALEAVFAPALEVLVSDGVDELDLGARGADLLAAGETEGGRYGRLLVVESAELIALSIARHPEGRAHEPVPAVCLATELLKGVGAKGQRALGVVGAGSAEPDARRSVKNRGVHGLPVVCERGVIRVCAPAVRDVGRVEAAVLVRHQDVSLAGFLAREKKGHVGHSPLGVLIRLHEKEVPADALVGDARGLVSMNLGLVAVGGDADQGGNVVEHVTLGGAGLGDDYGAERQRLVKARLAVLAGRQHERRRRRLGKTVELICPGVEVEPELRAREVLAALPGLAVELLDGDCHGAGLRRVLKLEPGNVAGRDIDLVHRLVERKPLRGLRLAHPVGACRKARRLRAAGGVCGHGRGKDAASFVGVHAELGPGKRIENVAGRSRIIG